MQRTLSGENKSSDLDEEIINDTLTASAIQKLRNEPEIPKTPQKLQKLAPAISSMYSMSSSEGLYS